MKKNYFKSFFALALMMIVSGNAFGQEVKFDFTTMDLPMSWSANADQGIEASTDGDITEETTFTEGGVTITISPATGGTANRFWKVNDAPQLRCYSGTLTISTTSNIAEVNFAAPNKFSMTPNVGILTNTTWKGSAKEIVFTVNANSQVNSITVTLGEGTETPTIPTTKVTSTATIDFNTMDVPVSSGTGDEYVSDGELTEDLSIPEGDIIFTATASTEEDKTPNRFWQTTNGPQLRLYNGTMTLKSNGDKIVGIKFGTTASNFKVATDENDLGQLSGVEWKGYDDEVTFTITGSSRLDNIVVSLGVEGDPEPVDLPTAGNIARLKAMEDGTEAVLTLDNAQVLYVNGKDMFVRDSYGAIDFYNLDLGFEAGQVLSGSLTGKLSFYKSLPEFVKTDNTDPETVNATAATTVEPATPGLDEIGAYDCDLVTITGATVSRAEDGNIYASTGDGEIQLYDRFKIGYTFEDGGVYDITGIVIPYNEIFELAPIAEFSNDVKKKPAFRKATRVEAGKQYIMVAKYEDENGAEKTVVAKPITSNYGYISVEEATEENGLIMTDETNAYTMEASAASGSDFAIQQSDGRYLYQKGTYNSFNVDAQPTEGQYWTITLNNDGETFNIFNTSVSKYVQYSVSHTSYGSYAEEQSGAALPMLYVRDDSATPTAITEVKAEEQADNAIYNVAGQRVRNAQKGIFIQNGNKYIVR